MGEVSWSQKFATKISDDCSTPDGEIRGFNSKAQGGWWVEMFIFMARAIL